MIALCTLLICPVLLVAATAAVRRTATLARTAAVLTWVQTAIAVIVCAPTLGSGAHASLAAHGFRLDGTAALFVILTTVVAAAALTHAIRFFQGEADTGHAPSLRDIRLFYAFTALFLISMYAVVSADNLGYLWIAVEATTLASAPLVYFHRSRTSLEATWKYLIICSVGIAFAFFGTAILFAASQQAGTLRDGSLSASELTASARLLPHGLLRFAFVFMLLGYGTKAGLFPLHSWLPDAHSEAPAPASALLSGALLNCALVALWRAASIMAAAGEAEFVRATLLPLGVATVVAASLFLLKQRDLKRLLAYSSMENVGMMAVAIALGSGSGFALQAINHSLVKVALFLLAGSLLQQYGTKTISDIRGVLATQPAQGVLLMLGVIAVAGTPPFGSFLAEWKILTAAADARHVTTVALLCAALAVAFIALSIQTGSILFGETGKHPRQEQTQRGFSLAAVPGLLVAASLALGVALPPAATAILERVGR